MASPSDQAVLEELKKQTQLLVVIVNVLMHANKLQSGDPRCPNYYPPPNP